MGTFGHNFSEALRKRGLTQQRAGNLCNVTHRAIAYYCRLKTPPHKNKVQWLSVCLGIPSAELLAGLAVEAVAESAVEYAAADPRIVWLTAVRVRWQRRQHRDELQLAVQLLFDRDAPAVLAWLSGEDPGGSKSDQTTGKPPLKPDLLIKPTQPRRRRRKRTPAQQNTPEHGATRLITPSVCT